MKPAANSSACLFARAQSRCLSDRLGLHPFSRHSILDQAGLRVGEHPHPVPAPFAGAVAPAASFRACHRSIPLDDGLHDLRGGKFAERGDLRQTTGAGHPPALSGRT